MLTIGTGSGGRGGISPAGLSHSVGICCLELAIMARGKGKAVGAGSGAGMPKFVDVKLTQDQKADFSGRHQSAEALVVQLQDLCDAGYRIGCSWSGEHQTYTVSLTCRDDQSQNNGYCMTSFAGQLDRAVSLALYKHFVVCGEVWSAGGPGSAEDFG
jgi:hypothetical protein